MTVIGGILALFALVAFAIIFYVANPQRKGSLVFMRHSVRKDIPLRPCPNEKVPLRGPPPPAGGWEDQDEYCQNLMKMGQDAEGNPTKKYDVPIRNCAVTYETVKSFDKKRNFLPDLVVTCEMLRAQQTAKVATKYYAEQRDHEVKRFLIDQRFSESSDAVKRDNKDTLVGVKPFGLEKQLWPNGDFEETIKSDISRDAPTGIANMLEAVKDLWKRNENVLVVTHDAWLTRILDMCQADQSNAIPRHVTENTIVMIDTDGQCFVHVPMHTCQPTEIMPRPETSVFNKFGSITKWLEI